MIGIKDIGVYIPSERIDNMNKSYNGHLMDKAFIKDKVGFVSLARMADNENTVELCLKALENLKHRLPDFDVSSVDFLCVCTQNGEYRLPHTSAILHGKLNLSPHCSTFDLNLGCSGYIYSLDVARHFMEGNDLKTGLLFTCDPYSKIVSPDDKSTDLIFGDAATVTLLTIDGAWKLGKPQYITKGSDASALIKKDDVPLFMDGRKIFNFVMRDGVAVIRKCLGKNNLLAEDVDRFLFHQASLYVVKNLAYQLKLPPEKVPFEAQEYGNTVSSSIPILLQALCPPHMDINAFSYADSASACQYRLYQSSERKDKCIFLWGCGVGLSLAAIPIFRR